MNFILISKKENFKNEDIDEEFLCLADAPSLISRESVKLEINNFILYAYPYNQVDHETYGKSYYSDYNKILFVNGIVNIDDEPRDQDIKKFFNQLNDSSTIIGDYQIISIDNNGNGIFKTPQLSMRQLFFYEDENCAVLSSEIKLIVDGLKKFREESFVNNFDIEFMEDAIFNEWGTRIVPQKTIFKDIKRIFPHDLKYFSEGKIVIERKHSVTVPNWFREAYNKDKDKLFDDYYGSLIKFVETNLVSLKPNINKIVLGLTGGLDSRLTVSILFDLCKKHEIQFECITYGQDDHPDVVIAQKIANVLQVKYIHEIPQDGLELNTADYEDYAATFYMAQGDFNSKNFLAYYDRKIKDLNTLNQTGRDGYKRVTMNKVYGTNRWDARIMLSHNNFYFPLFNTSYESWFALIYNEIGEDAYYEFVYEILKRSQPELLNIPFVGDNLPQIDIKPYSTTAESKFHEREPFLWDYDLVKKNLKPLFEKKFNQLNEKSKLLLDLIGLDQFDYFIDEKFRNKINLLETDQLDSKEFREYIIKQRLSENYPKSCSMIEFTKEELYNPYYNTLQILMDFAVVANYHSFRQIEKKWERSVS